MIDLDHFDLALLDVLQRFGRATHQQLGEQVPLSPSRGWLPAAISRAAGMQR